MPILDPSQIVEQRGKIPKLGRKIAIIESDGILFRIRKGDVVGPWTKPSELASLDNEGRKYIAFLDPLAYIFEGVMKPNTIYYVMGTHTRMRAV